MLSIGDGDTVRVASLHHELNDDDEALTPVISTGHSVDDIMDLPWLGLETLPDRSRMTVDLLDVGKNRMEFNGRSSVDSFHTAISESDADERMMNMHHSSGSSSLRGVDGPEETERENHLVRGVRSNRAYSVSDMNEVEMQSYYSQPHSNQQEEEIEEEGDENELGEPPVYFGREAVSALNRNALDVVGNDADEEEDGNSYDCDQSLVTSLPSLPSPTLFSPRKGEDPPSGKKQSPHARGRGKGATSGSSSVSGRRKSVPGPKTAVNKRGKQARRSPAVKGGSSVVSLRRQSSVSSSFNHHSHSHAHSHGHGHARSLTSPKRSKSASRLDDHTSSSDEYSMKDAREREFWEHYEKKSHQEMLEEKAKQQAFEWVEGRRRSSEQIKRDREREALVARNLFETPSAADLRQLKQTEAEEQKAAQQQQKHKEGKRGQGDQLQQVPNSNDEEASVCEVEIPLFSLWADAKDYNVGATRRFNAAFAAGLLSSKASPDSCIVLQGGASLLHVAGSDLSAGGGSVKKTQSESDLSRLQVSGAGSKSGRRTGIPKSPRTPPAPKRGTTFARAASSSALKKTHSTASLNGSGGGAGPKLTDWESEYGTPASMDMSVFTAPIVSSVNKGSLDPALWTPAERFYLQSLFSVYGRHWKGIGRSLKGLKTVTQIRTFFYEARLTPLLEKYVIGSDAVSLNKKTVAVQRQIPFDPPKELVDLRCDISHSQVMKLLGTMGSGLKRKKIDYALEMRHCELSCNLHAEDWNSTMHLKDIEEFSGNSYNGNGSNIHNKIGQHHHKK